MATRKPSAKELEKRAAKLSKKSLTDPIVDPKTGKSANASTVNVILPAHPQLSAAQNAGILQQSIPDLRKSARPIEKGLAQVDDIRSEYRLALAEKLGDKRAGALGKISQDRQKLLGATPAAGGRQSIEKLAQKYRSEIQRAGIDSSGWESLRKPFVNRASRALDAAAFPGPAKALLPSSGAQPHPAHGTTFERFWFGRTTRFTEGNGNVTRFLHYNVPNDGFVGHFHEYVNLDPGDFDYYIWSNGSQVGEVVWLFQGESYCIDVDLMGIFCQLDYDAKDEVGFSGGRITFNTNMTVDVGSFHFVRSLLTSQNDTYLIADNVQREVMIPWLGPGDKFNYGDIVRKSFTTGPMPKSAAFIVWVGVQDVGTVRLNDFQMRKMKVSSLWDVKKVTVSKVSA